jgi:hypothetical protein
MNWLVVDLPLLKNMSSSNGMIKFPTEWKVIKIYKNIIVSKPPTGES